MSKERKIYSAKQLCFIAMLTAVTAVLAVFGTFRIGNVIKFPTKFISVFICGALFGPFAGGFSAAIGDILNVFLAPSGAWIPWLTLTEFAEGFLLGAFFYKKSFDGYRYFLRAVFCALVLFVIGIFVTTYILTLYGYFPSYKAGLTVRILPEALKAVLKFGVMIIGMRVLPLFKKEVYGSFKNYANSFQTVTKPGLERISALLEEFGNPQDMLKCIHIAGTNGKGSVAAFLQTMFTEAGHRTGKYISPNMIKVNERISIDGNDIADSELDVLLKRIEAVTDKVKEKTGDYPTQFEIWTAAAFIFFAEKKCDYVVLETGLGGRLDATNVIKRNILAVITHIDIDHTEYLGNTIAKIASEKAGIIKKGCPVVCAEQAPEAETVIKDTAKKLDCEVCSVKTPLAEKFEDIYEIYDDGEIRAKLSLGGINQLENAALAVKAAKVLGIENKYIVYGLENAKNPGRFEKIGEKIIYDGAHNPDGVKKLVMNIKRYYPNIKPHIIMASMKDKDIKSSLTLLSELDAVFCFTEVMNNERSEKAENLVKIAEECGICAKAFKNINKALKYAENADLTVICGSLYLYKDFMNA